MSSKRKQNFLVKNELKPQPRVKMSEVKFANKIDLDDRPKDISMAMPVSDGIEDTIGMMVLLLLYTLQGIPMGLCGSIPLIMKEQGVSYEGLSLFSLVSIPFSLKLLWAPLVDSCFFRKVGRRKTWIIPVQILTGIVMLTASPYIDTWMGINDVNPTEETKGPQVGVLTTFFLFLYFLMATQDIVVDGWALTMLSPKNVGYASVCNSIGQSCGYFLANQGIYILRLSCQIIHNYESTG
jgi:MFS transporter, PAT family, solute carrier family 33 (acetyl-CoA transportor), member 1